MLKSKSNKENHAAVEPTVTESNAEDCSGHAFIARTQPQWCALAFTAWMQTMVLAAVAKVCAEQKRDHQKCVL